MRVLIAVCAVVLAWSPRADAAALGDLSFEQCLRSATPASSCVFVSATDPNRAEVFDRYGDDNPLVLLSPDGRHLYYVNQFHVGLINRVASTHTLTPGPTFKDGLRLPSYITDVDISDDGRKIGVVGDAGVAFLSRDPTTGAVTHDACMVVDERGAGFPGCSSSTALLADHRRVEISPDGRTLFLSVNPSGQANDPAAKVQTVHAASGSLVAGDPTTVPGVGDIALVPGTEILVAGSADGLRTLRRSGNGLVTQSCLSASGASGCTTSPAGTGFAASVLVTPDRAHVLMVGNRLVEFPIDAGGNLGSSVTSCLDGVPGGTCGDVPSFGPNSLSAGLMSVSPDGRSVYMVENGEVVIEVDRAANGALSYSGCARRTVTPAPCSAIPAEAGVMGVNTAVSPDGLNLYTPTVVPCCGEGGYLPGLLAFSRARTPICASRSAVVGAGATTPIDTSCVTPTGYPPTGVSITVPPSHGTLGAAGVTSRPYTPAAGFLGADGFTFRSTNAIGASDPATVSIDARAQPGVPDCPDREVTLVASTRTTVDLGCTVPPGQSAARYEILGAPAIGQLGALDATTGEVSYTAPDQAGAAEFTYRAIGDAGGSAPATVRVTITPDTTPPDTAISEGPGDGARVDADNGPPRYVFTSEPRARFRCRLRPADSDVAVSDWRACTSPETAPYPAREGDFVFEVAAIDPSGNIDPTPAARTFTLFGVRPRVTITDGPGRRSQCDLGLACPPVLGTAPVFSFVSDIPGSRFECNLRRSFRSLDTGWRPCTSPYKVDEEFVYRGDRYWFEVRAVAPNGRTGGLESIEFQYRPTDRPRQEYGNMRIRGIDVFQVVQANNGAQRYGYPALGSFPRSGTYAGGGTPTDWLTDTTVRDNDLQRVQYQGVALDPDKRTRAVVYLDNEHGTGDLQQPLLLTLTMHVGNFRIYQQTQRVVNPGTGGRPFVSELDRIDPQLGFQFEIERPRAAQVLANRNDFSLEATVQFQPGTTRWDTQECEPNIIDCDKDNRFRLDGVRVASGWGDLRLASLQLVTGTQRHRRPDEVLQRARELLPNLLGTYPPPYTGDPISVDTQVGYVKGTTPAPGVAGTGNRECDAIDTTRSCRNAYVASVVDQWSTRNPARTVEGNQVRRNYDVVLAVEDYPTGNGNGREPGFASGTLDDVTKTGPTGAAPRLVVNANRRPISAAAHEFGHILKAPHADLGCGGNSNGQTGEAWPPDDRGRLQSAKLDAERPATPVVDGASGQTLYDMMSYCGASNDTDTSDGDQWISAFQWNRLDHEFTRLGLRVPRGQTLFPRSANALRAARVGLTRAFASGIVTEAGGRIERIVPPDGDSAAPTGGQSSPVRLHSLGAAGQVLLDVGIDVRALADSPGTGTFVGPVATDAVAVALVRDGTVLDRVERSKPPVVRLLTPRAGTRVGPRRSLDVRWTSSDPDGGRSSAQAVVDFSGDGGRTWQTVHTGPDKGRVRLSPRALPRSAQARIRVGVNDGFSETRATSGSFRTDGVPPVATIVAPGSGESLHADRRSPLVGMAYDDSGERILSRNLRWFAGRTPLGRGEQVLARIPARAFVLRLVARDASGRTGTASLRVGVRRTPFRLTTLTYARRVRRGTRSLTVTVQAPTPATLRAAGRSYRIDGRRKRIAVPLPKRPVAGVLRVAFRATPRTSSATGSAVGRIEVRRG